MLNFAQQQPQFFLLEYFQHLKAKKKTESSFMLFVAIRAKHSQLLSFIMFLCRLCRWVGRKKAKRYCFFPFFVCDRIHLLIIA